MRGKGSPVSSSGTDQVINFLLGFSIEMKEGALNFICPLFLFEAGSEQVQDLIFRLTPLFFMFLWLKEEMMVMRGHQGIHAGDLSITFKRVIPEESHGKGSDTALFFILIIMIISQKECLEKTDSYCQRKKSQEREERQESLNIQVFLLFLRHHQVHHQNLVFSFLSLSSSLSCILRQFFFTFCVATFTLFGCPSLSLLPVPAPLRVSSPSKSS